MNNLYRKSEELRRYVGLSDAQVELAARAWSIIEPDLDSFVQDFYNEILRHEATRRVFKDAEQVHRLQVTLRRWIEQLFTAKHDEAFVARRWAVGLRHVQIGLESVWVSMAMSRLRDQMLQSLAARFPSHRDDLPLVASAISRLMDLDLAIIQDAYHAESVANQLAAERDFAEGVIATAQAVVMMVTHDGTIVRVNQFLAKRLQWPQQEADLGEQVQANCIEFVAESQREVLRAFIDEAANDGTPAPLETSLLAATGPSPRVRWHARKYNNQWVLCVGQDISELADAQNRLVRSERLAAIGQTMAGLAHESRNAFQRSQAALETLSLELEDRPTAVKLIARIQRAHDHLLHLYEEVLQFARPVRLEIQPLSLVPLIQQTWDHIRLAMNDKPIRLSYVSAPPHVELSGDPFALEQAFRNLLENAIDASPADATIHVRLEEVWLGADRGIQIRIRDYGKGLSDEACEHAFEPFFTTRSRGTGLGLPISRRLIEGHGGTLDLRPGTPGVEAIVTIPLQARPVQYNDASLTTDYRRSPPS